ncbi:hypothetical protein [uncultured Litoreibacter sp.]|uniref:hypothetical protein n=1 Tax=uncultured Litoreibacter sp. TaxID=1392394 RepID=UPI002636EAF8|nr:hypothetical protein [uncultured Litoreibacter sp.]
MAKATKMMTANMMSISHALMGEIKVGSQTLSYKFFLRADTPGRTNAAPLTISGSVREVGTDFVRLRKSSGYRTHTDIVIPFHSILYFEETYRSRGGE